MPSLMTLGVSSNSFVNTSSLLNDLSSLSNLRFLDVSTCNISAPILRTLQNLSSIVHLDLSNNEIFEEIPKSLSNLCNLITLDLQSNNFFGDVSELLERFCECPFLLYDVLFQNIVLGRASLVTKGRVSTYDNILYLVTTLDLSNNKFSGSIPDELVSLLGLRYLNLSHNNLTGRIPNLFSKSGVLESLDLSVNHLDGKFPSSLSALTTLNFLNVSYNNLVGRIPTGSQLQTMNESSFIGNALCEYPLPACSQNNGNPRGTNDKHDESNGIDWILIICTLIGLIIGFWIIIAPLIFSERFRNTYYHFLEDIWIKIQNFILIMFPCFRRRKPRNEILFSNDQVQNFDLSQYIYGEPKGFHKESSSEASSSTHKIQQSD
ncbi:hypothetical protein E3N88_45402 [Mikania micrantha]|uniref:Leucine-rich repeat-containing N-terminal plant-type domain-containing protein n=1 Tax=Mikania micrantha TaxID=192012 RepID=A0A5N6L9G6_9ASTR|nr:hypothetical protein E3N88_45402 [Mikania micrantha]